MEKSYYSLPIQMRVDELVSGVRAQIAVKLFGEDMKVLQEKASQITAVLKNIRGVAVLNGIVLVSYINKLREDGFTFENAIMTGCED